MAPSLKRERVVETAWIFDVDEVVTNPQEKRITEPEILDQIIKRLKRREPVALNTGRSVEWVKSKGIKPQRYIAFGDSFSPDISMAEEIHSQGLPVEFIYVGRENLPVLDYPFPIKQTLAHFGNGTLEYLNTL